MTEQELFTSKINTLMQCDPSQCQKSNCMLYHTAYKGCDALEFLRIFDYKITDKFKNASWEEVEPEIVITYPVEAQNIEDSAEKSAEEKKEEQNV